MPKMLVCPYDLCKHNNHNLCQRENVVLKLTVVNDTETMDCESFEKFIVKRLIKLDHDYEHQTTKKIYKVSGISVDQVLLYNVCTFKSNLVPLEAFLRNFKEV